MTWCFFFVTFGPCVHIETCKCLITRPTFQTKQNIKQNLAQNDDDDDYDDDDDDDDNDDDENR